MNPKEGPWTPEGGGGEEPVLHRMTGTVPVHTVNTIMLV